MQLVTLVVFMLVIVSLPFLLYSLVGFSFSADACSRSVSLVSWPALYRRHVRLFWNGIHSHLLRDAAEVYLGESE